MAYLKVSDVFKLAAALIYESTTGINSDAESKNFSIDFLNIHLQECLEVENSVRRANGETELTAAPWITSQDDEIPYCNALVRAALPYALAWHFYAEAMDSTQANTYRALYEVRKSQAVRYVFEDITDAYATEE